MYRQPNDTEYQRTAFKSHINDEYIEKGGAQASANTIFSNCGLKGQIYWNGPITKFIISHHLQALAKHHMVK
jgi:hypothetical protein